MDPLPNFARPALRWAAAAASLPSLLLLCIGAAALAQRAAPPPTPQQLIERHRGALGTAEARAAAGKRVIRGRFDFRRLDNEAEYIGPAGKATLVADGRKLGVLLEFGHPDYEREAFAFDGERVTTSWINPDVRSPLAEVLAGHELLLREGLMGGVLGAGWALASEQPASELAYAGRRALTTRMADAWNYAPSGGSEIRIQFYFDDNFRHVRSVYEGRSQEASFAIEESFELFRTFEGLQLPTRWTVRHTAKAGTVTSTWIWSVRFEQFSFSEAPDRALFVVN